MSYLINNGFKIQQSNLTEIDELVISIKNEFELILKDFYLKVIEEVKNKKYNKSNLEWHLELLDATNKNSKFSELFLPEVKLDFYSINNYYTLFLVQCDNLNLRNILVDKLNDLSFVEEYFYQNKTDKPKEYTDKEWKKRHVDWVEMAFKKTPFQVNVFVKEDYINFLFN